MVVELLKVISKSQSLNNFSLSVFSIICIDGSISCIRSVTYFVNIWLGCGLTTSFFSGSDLTMRQISQI